MTRPRSLLGFSLLLLVAVLGSGCHPRATTVHTRVSRPASVEVEIYDRFDGFPLPNARVRVVSVWHEWSGLETFSPYFDAYLTDGTGYVAFDAFDLADYEVGFLLDRNGQAVLPPGAFEDDAIVTLEVWLPGEAPYRFEVPLEWRRPAALVAVDY
jgi:hypothetical protein